MIAKAKVVAWLLAAVNAWGASPIPIDERDTAADTRAAVASDMASVAYDSDEPSLYPREVAGRAHTALLETSIAALESRFRADIISGHCKSFECDPQRNAKTGKIEPMAVGLLQIHAGLFGIRLVGAKAVRCDRRGEDCLTAFDLARDEVAQIRVGLHLLRTQGLAGFTGEGTVEGPVSAARRQQADDWLAKHPAPATDAEVMAEGIAQR
jgi:hypothetical protein